ncbi:Initiator Replication protein [Peptoclostridium litorale DSM 5388]|uniref:Putative replication initiator protein n=2 Tax=Peptoclostridium litorale TaxID=1557 RepID=A0A069RL00_PEPLI|nr:replication initiation protein [Peptoclostridium litorale]KDR96795.1 putative replication initiator protein [Peptoclostridium litorale DSM 5388]SIO36212.1 Initiator Replication protein [Peptoclostridium litorale DSM 5388]
MDLYKDNYVVKANQFIQAKGRLGVLEQKLLATLISEIRMEDEDFKKYRLDIKEVGEFIGLNSGEVYTKIREAIRSLKKKSIEIERYNPDTQRLEWETFGLIGYTKIIEGIGYITIRIDPELKPYLLAIKGEETPFTKYLVKNILKLNSSYSIRIYELLKQYEKKRSREFKLEELKDLLDVTEEKSYKRFDNFERRILKKAEEEINAKTDIKISYKKEKTGRKISEIIFKIIPKEEDEDQKVLEALTSSNERDEIRQKCGLAESNFSDKQVMELYTKSVEITDNLNDMFNITPYKYISKGYEIMLKQKDVKYKFSYLKKLLEKGKATIITELIEEGI